MKCDTYRQTFRLTKYLLNNLVVNNIIVTRFTNFDATLVSTIRRCGATVGITIENHFAGKQMVHIECRLAFSYCRSAPIKRQMALRVFLCRVLFAIIIIMKQ